MKTILFWITCFLFITSRAGAEASEDYSLFPSDKSQNVNPDTHLKITFKTYPAPGKSGQIRIYDKSNDRLVDLLDLSIPAGPTERTPSPSATYSPVPYEYVSEKHTNANTKAGNPSGVALPTPFNYQLTIIGGFTDGFHFHPIIINGNTATIYPHNNLLEYNKTYYIQVDPDVLSIKENKFDGIKGKDDWTFSTKKEAPSRDSKTLTISDDGTGDFNTVQGAIDFIPDFNPEQVTVFIRNGFYEEIVYFRNKSNITILGENRDSVIVFYGNSEVFNPHPLTVLTNEVPGTFPSRRAAFTVDNSKRIRLINLTIKTTAYGQAEGLLINGEEIIVSHVTIIGSGDALQSNGSVYYTDCQIIGDGDTILGRGPAFFNNCELNSYGVYMWIRNTDANHGNVFVNCRFKTRGDRETEIARAPTNGGKNYPYCEAVLINCALSGIVPEGWGEIGGETANVHYWEYNSTNLIDGKPDDTSKRHPASRQLTMKKDAEIISNYMNPAFVLGGWNPSVAPIILTQPQNIVAGKGQAVLLSVKATAIPAASYQWFKNDKPLKGANKASLTLNLVNTGHEANYSVLIKNDSGSALSKTVSLRLN